MKLKIQCSNQRIHQPAEHIGVFVVVLATAKWDHFKVIFDVKITVVFLDSFF